MFDHLSVSFLSKRLLNYRPDCSFFCCRPGLGELIKNFITNNPLNILRQAVFFNFFSTFFKIFMPFLRGIC